MYVLYLLHHEVMTNLEEKAYSTSTRLLRCEISLYAVLMKCFLKQAPGCQVAVQLIQKVSGGVKVRDECRAVHEKRDEKKIGTKQRVDMFQRSVSKKCKSASTQDSTLRFISNFIVWPLKIQNIGTNL